MKDCFGNDVKVGDIVVCHSTTHTPPAKILVTHFCRNRMYGYALTRFWFGGKTYETIKQTYRASNRFIIVTGQMAEDIRKEFAKFEVK
jgi:hypothetical protein